MLGQIDEGSQMGVLNLFDNVDDLIDDVILGNNVRDKQKDILKLSRGDVNGVPNVDGFKCTTTQNVNQQIYHM